MATELLCLPQLVSLREVVGASGLLLEAVAKRQSKLRWTRLTGFSCFHGATFESLDLLAEHASALPKLTHLELSAAALTSFDFEEYECLFASSLMRQLEFVDLRCEEHELQVMLDALVKLKVPQVVLHAGKDIEVTWNAKTKTLTAPEHLASLI